MKLTQEQVNDLFIEDEIEVDGVDLTLVERGEFEQDGKYQDADVIFTDGNKHYRSFVTRTGSPFTEWEWEDYGEAHVEEVEKREVTVTRWMPV